MTSSRMIILLCRIKYGNMRFCNKIRFSPLAKSLIISSLFTIPYYFAKKLPDGISEK